mgnify:CR=1 FL=1
MEGMISSPDKLTHYLIPLTITTAFMAIDSVREVIQQKGQKIQVIIIAISAAAPVTNGPSFLLTPSLISASILLMRALTGIVTFLIAIDVYWNVKKSNRKYNLIVR